MVGEVPSFVKLLTFKVSGRALEVCAVPCTSILHADGQVYFWFLVLPFLCLFIVLMLQWGFLVTLLF